MTDLRQPNRVTSDASSMSFVPARHKPRYLGQGEMGAASETIPGDMVVLALGEYGARLATVGWHYTNGAVAVAIAGHDDAWHVCQRSCCLRSIRADTPLRFFALRPGRG